MLQASSKVVSINSRLGISPSTCPRIGPFNVSYLDSVIGVAIFDLNGLPKEYFITSKSSDGNWIQASFQAIGLQSLLMSSLRLEGFRHTVIHGKEHRTIVIKQKTRYLAVLLPVAEAVSPEFLRWAQEFEPTSLKADPRFTQA
jgi:predicted regulator of Ras-like GTPase activity (Roadblock/LC7/MglB family)